MSGTINNLWYKLLPRNNSKKNELIQRSINTHKRLEEESNARIRNTKAKKLMRQAKARRNAKRNKRNANEAREAELNQAAENEFFNKERRLQRQAEEYARGIQRLTNERRKLEAAVSRNVREGEKIRAKLEANRNANEKERRRMQAEANAMQAKENKRMQANRNAWMKRQRAPLPNSFTNKQRSLVEKAKRIAASVY